MSHLQLSRPDREHKEKHMSYNYSLGRMLGFYTVVAFLFWHIVNTVQPGKLIDEIFHVTQAQNYCSGNFTHWDEKITTLPGLYILSVGLLYPTANVLGVELAQLCTTQTLRLTNVLLSIANVYLFFTIFNKLHAPTKVETANKNVFGALNLGLWPPLLFFSSTYYTDMAATFMVILMLSLHLHGNNFMASLAGLFSIFVRQTNIVWVLWVGARVFDFNLRESLYFTRAERCYENVHTVKEIQCIFRGFQRVRDRGAFIKMMVSTIATSLGYITGDGVEPIEDRERAHLNENKNL
ncbi:dol-P-Glc:Glc(2)Man(9)GlcNAc(2)-PP-Dol alpha-1,2-glucosyltransferase-like isoform X3 [Artemia franciscana]|uniref:dol-P-Glc:Glc(2)Man(9)GlcNAc(2)-PP-Dol alpha-1,2-glucosyltransferase-like isoform X3 n=1 Tax=Artemia franciscana TaxID=6661 RepID=UPI0032DB85D3